jgi:hypothetical protein
VEAVFAGCSGGTRAGSAHARTCRIAQPRRAWCRVRLQRCPCTGGWLLYSPYKTEHAGANTMHMCALEHFQPAPLNLLVECPCFATVLLNLFSYRICVYYAFLISYKNKKKHLLSRNNHLIINYWQRFNFNHIIETASSNIPYTFHLWFTCTAITLRHTHIAHLCHCPSTTESGLHVFV